MPLSEREQRVLAEIERDLDTDDPKLAAVVRSATARNYTLARLRRFALVFALGMAILVTATVINSGAGSIAIGVLGFVVMLLAALRGSDDVRRAWRASQRHR